MNQIKRNIGDKIFCLCFSSRDRKSGAVICRSSQPEVGWLGWRSQHDENLIAAIAAACEQTPLKQQVLHTVCSKIESVQHKIYGWPLKHSFTHGDTVTTRITVSLVFSKAEDAWYTVTFKISTTFTQCQNKKYLIYRWNHLYIMYFNSKF